MLKTICIEPKQSSATASVIWLHGLGANGHDFVPALPELRLRTDHPIRFIFPHAPLCPVTCNGGMVMPAWFDIFSFDFKQRFQEDETGIRQAQRQLEALIASEIEKGILAKHIILVGFSQGGALTLHTAVRCTQTLGGVAGLSTYLPLASQLEKEKNSKNLILPIFMAHGLHDPIIPYWGGEKSYAVLKAAGYHPIWQAYPMAHSVCEPELNALGEWMQGILL